MSGAVDSPFGAGSKSIHEVLVVHNRYRSDGPSGENHVFEAEQRLLRNHGVAVSTFVRDSDELVSQGVFGKIRAAAAVPWNPRSAAAIRQHLDDHPAQVVHVHNTFPLISPSVFAAIGRRAARVLTLHNYRVVCPAAIPMRDGRLCTECIDRRSALPALIHGCYRRSRLATLPLALNVDLHRWLGTWQRHVDAFIVLSEFQRQTMTEAGFPAHKVHIKPNFHEGDLGRSVPWQQRLQHAVYVGRLSEEKGLRTLVRAWLNWGAGAPVLKIIGDGPLRSELEQVCAGAPVQFLGLLPSGDVLDVIAKARLLVLPSEWFETFGLVVIEAFAHGTPVIVSDMGALPSLVDDGLTGRVFNSGNAEHLLAVLQDTWPDDELLQDMGERARATYELKYTAETNFQQLMRIYEQAQEVNRSL